MRISIPLSTVLLTLSAFTSAEAQNNRHLFVPGEGGLPNRFFRGATVATRFGGSIAGEVECFSDLSASQFKGIGASSNTSCALTGQIVVIQDQDGLTSSPFQVILRNPVAPDGLPDGSAAGVIAASGIFNTPVNTVAGPAAWFYTITWATPVTVPCETGFFLGAVLFPQASATDFTLVQSAGAINTTTPAGDNPRVPAPKFHAARVDQPAGTATQSVSAATLCMVALTNQATLNIGNIDPTVGATPYISYGLGGLYPAAKAAPRDDGLGCRVEDATNAGGSVAVFVSVGFFPGGFFFPGITGALWVDPTTFTQVAVGALPATAPVVFEAVMAPPGSIPFAPGFTATFTGLTLGVGGPRFTNSQATTL